MTSEQEALQRARAQMSEENFTAAEQSLLQAMVDLPPNIEIYNLLMELYYKVELFSKVIEYFKQATIKFPDLNLNSYFMVSDNLLKANAIKECELDITPSSKEPSRTWFRKLPINYLNSICILRPLLFYCSISLRIITAILVSQLISA